jgi:hypothetical protein
MDILFKCAFRDPRGAMELLDLFPQRLSKTLGDSKHRPHQVVIDVVLKVIQKVCNVGMSYSTKKPDLGWESTKFRILNPGVGRYLVPDDELDGNIANATFS